VRIRILFTGTDDDGQSCALLISLPSFFSPPVALLLPSSTEEVNQRHLYCFSYIFSPLPPFCSLLGAVSLVVLSSYRNDTIIFICLAKLTLSGFWPLSPIEACHRCGTNCTFPFPFIPASTVGSLRLYKLHPRITALTVEQSGQPINIFPLGPCLSILIMALPSSSSSPAGSDDGSDMRLPALNKAGHVAHCVRCLDGLPASFVEIDASR
jgi:hypothetical protein